MKKLAMRIIAAAVIMLSGNFLCAQFIERDGKTYVQKDDGSLVEVQIKAPPPSDGELYRPSRAGKFGTPHRGAWLRRVEDTNNAAATVNISEDNASNGSADNEPPKSSANSLSGKDVPSSSFTPDAAAIYTAFKSGRCILRVELIQESGREALCEPIHAVRQISINGKPSFSAPPTAKICIADSSSGKEISYPLGLSFSVSDFSFYNSDGAMSAVFNLDVSFSKPKMSAICSPSYLEETPVSTVGVRAPVKLLSTENFSAQISNQATGIKLKVSLAFQK